MALDLPQSPRCKVFREVCSILRADPVIARTIRKGAFRCWEGAPNDSVKFTIEHAPAIRLTPTTGPDDFATPDSMKGALLVNCEILVSGNNADDLLNLWWAVCMALYPADLDARNALCLRLQNAGARSGLVLFSQPAFDPKPDGIFFAGTAQMRIDVESRFN